jgi:hypothetical protein
MHHFTDGGLQNVWLVNGYTVRKTPYDEAASVHDLDGLTQAVVAWADRAKKDGMEEGRREGRMEGQQEGASMVAQRTLERLLTRRFGPLPPGSRQPHPSSRPAPARNVAGPHHRRAFDAGGV